MNYRTLYPSLIASLPAILILLVVSLGIFGPAGDDDGHITYSSALNFAEHGQITNHNDQYVEQGSSLLHVALLGSTYRVANVLGLVNSITAFGPVFSLCMGILCLPLCLLFAQQAGIKKPQLATILLSLSTAFSYWAMGGLESTLAALCFLLLAFALSRYLSNPEGRVVSLAIFLLAFLLVRPEASLVAMAMLGFLLLAFYLRGDSQQLKHSAVVMGLCLALSLLIMATRFSYYGQFFPQPVYAKAEGFSLLKMAIGLYYFVYSKQLTIIIYCTCVLLLLRKIRELSLPLLVSLAACLSYIAFIINAGGDWMAGGRFFVPILPLLIILCLHQLQTRMHFRRYAIFLVVLCVIEITGFALKLSAGIPFWQTTSFRQQYSGINWQDFSWTETNNLVHARDIPATSALINMIKALPQQNKAYTVASIQMGMVSYHLHQQFGPRIELVDMRALTTQHLNQCSILQAFPRTWSGISIRYSDYFAAQPQCQLPTLDIIYDLLNREPDVNAERLASIQQQGYTIVYRQQGQFMPPNGLKSVDADAFIAVSPAILQQLPPSLHAISLQFGKGLTPATP